MVLYCFHFLQLSWNSFPRMDKIIDLREVALCTTTSCHDVTSSLKIIFILQYLWTQILANAFYLHIAIKLLWWFWKIYYSDNRQIKQMTLTYLGQSSIFRKICRSVRCQNNSVVHWLKHSTWLIGSNMIGARTMFSSVRKCEAEASVDKVCQCHVNIFTFWSFSAII